VEVLDRKGNQIPGLTISILLWKKTASRGDLQFFPVHRQGGISLAAVLDTSSLSTKQYWHLQKIPAHFCPQARSSR